MADTGHHDALSALRQGMQCCIALLPVQPGQPDLDQLMVGKCPLGLGDDALCQAGIAHENHGFEGVRQTLQVPALFLGKYHPATFYPTHAVRRLEGCGRRPHEPPLTAPLTSWAVLAGGWS